MNLDSLEESALNLLQSACTPFGILASPDDQENYQRLWSRDAMIAGIAALPSERQKISEAFAASIRTLAKYQHPRGMIPSNVLPDEDDPEISYGGLAGRVDATSWFVVGSCLYLLNSEDSALKQELQPHLEKALDVLDLWEFNARGLLYTPLSGNWADEYPIQGHTLYDNCLRLWALNLYASYYNDEVRATQATTIQKLVTLNFWPKEADSEDPGIYHPRRFKQAAGMKRRHFSCALDPTGYDERFDAAGHGLALLLGLPDQQQLDAIESYVGGIFDELNHNLLPAFWPVITPTDSGWEALKKNYSYDFKNHPHKFHNGGIWPVWMGLFGLGMRVAGRSKMAEQMLSAWMEMENETPEFYEYIGSDTFRPGGKEHLSYSASGLLFLLEAINSNKSLRQDLSI